jgi:ABC-type lipoprotein release transport system permease subunit
MVSLGIGMTSMLDVMIGQNADLSMIMINYHKGMAGEGGVEPEIMNDKKIAELKKLPHVKAVMPLYNVSLSFGFDIALYSPEQKFTVHGGSIYAVDMDEMENFGYKLTAGHFKTPKDPENSIILGAQINTSVMYYEEDEYKSSKNYPDGSNIPTDPMFDPMKTELHIEPIPIIIESSSQDGSSMTTSPDISAIGVESLPAYYYDQEVKVIGVLKGTWANNETMNGVLMDMKLCNQIIDNYNDLHSEDPGWSPSTLDPNVDGYPQVMLRVDNMDNVSDIEKQITKMGYLTYSANEQREAMHQQLAVIQLILGAFAGISLFVAALNITNTMIMAIVERTKEIGIMKVLGCDISKIRLLFLGEAASIGLLGGIIGVILSFIVSILLNRILTPMVAEQLSLGAADMTGLSISVIPWWLVFGAIGFSTLIGMLAGIYPSGRSVKISALAAISHD